MARKIKEFVQVRNWANERGIYLQGDAKTQTMKLNEELGEFSRAVLKNDIDEVKDSLGDMQVVLINLATLCGYSLEECLESAWNEIKDRQGKMENGTFKKK